MKMRIRSLLAQALCIYLSVGISVPSFAGVVVQSSPEFTIAKNVDTRALANAKPEYVKTLSEMLRAIGAKRVTCTSGYRSPQQQAAACRKICGNPNGCP